MSFWVKRRILFIFLDSSSLRSSEWHQKSNFTNYLISYTTSTSKEILISQREISDQPASSIASSTK